MNKEDTFQSLRDFFTFGDAINAEALTYVLNELKQLLTYLETEN